MANLSLVSDSFHSPHSSTVMITRFCEMKIVKIINFAIGLILIASAQSYLEPIFTIHENGYGPVKIGMTIPEASKALGIALIPPQALDQDDKHCYYVYPNGNPKLLGFMVENTIITRVDVFSKGYFTNTGIQIGDKEEKIFKEYLTQILAEKIHPYLGKNGKYIIVKTSEKNRIIFETEQDIIILFRIGMLPSVDYIEGCL